MRNMITVVAAALALSACSTAPSDELDVSTAQMGKVDAWVPPPQTFDTMSPPPDDSGVVADPDSAMELDDQGVVTPDMGEEPTPDQGIEPGDPLVATIVLTELPQGPSATLDIAVSVAAELVGEPGCAAVDVDPNANPAAPPSFDAGAISVSGINGGPYMSNLVPGGAYPSPQVPDNLFGDGAVVQAQAAGGIDMGAFQVQLTVPVEVNLTSPAQFGTSIRTNQDLVVRWTPGVSESILITVSPAASPFDPAPRAGRWVLCTGDDNGNLTIPGATLSEVSAGSGALVVAVTRTRVASTSIGPHEAFLTASTTTGALVGVQ